MPCGRLFSVGSNRTFEMKQPTLELKRGLVVNRHDESTLEGADVDSRLAIHAQRHGWRVDKLRKTYGAGGKA